MKNKKIGRQIIIFLIIIAIINSISMVSWFIFRFSPIIQHLDSFKDTVAFELNKEYSTIEDLKNTLNSIAKNKNIGFRIEDSNKNVILEEEKKGIMLFSEITNIDGKTYFVSFISYKSVNISKLIFEGCLFQVFELTISFLLLYLLSRRKIIKPTESIIEDIRNYKFGKKPKRREINNEFDLIQNEFVNLTDKLDDEKMEQNRIIASISHDIKTPLTSIIGYADLNKDEDNIEILKKYNNKIVEKALHIKDILSTFDDYLVNYDKTPLKITKVSINDIVEELNNDYKIELENNNIKFEIITKLNNEFIEVDILKLKRIFSNLISNSTRYISDDGKITVEILDENDKFKFIVKDNGKGIDKEIIEKVFDPFYTTDKSRKISGLGLSICKEFVEMHKGTIKAYNDNGFVIEFTIPKGK